MNLIIKKAKLFSLVIVTAGFHLSAQAQWWSFNSPEKKQSEYAMDIEEFKKLGKDDHVVQFQQGEFLYTLIPVKDHVLNDKRREVFSASIELGKLVLKEWIKEAAGIHGLIEKETDIKAIEAALESLETESDEDIRKMLKDGRLPQMPGSLEIVRKAKRLNDVLDQKKAKRKFVESIDKTLVELEREGDQIVLDNGEKVSLMDSLVPSAFIASFGFKIPAAKLESLQAGMSAGGITSMAYRGIYMLGKLFSGNTATISVIMRPWLKHVRNLNTNEIYVSEPSSPSTWHMEPSVQVWMAKDAVKAKPTGMAEEFKPNLRLGLGLLWGQFDRLTEISGVFTGPSMTMTTPAQLTTPLIKSVNVKAGVIIPSVKAANPLSIFKYKYIMVSPQLGVPLVSTRAKQWNIGYIMNLTEFLDVPVFTPAPIQKNPGVIITPGQPFPITPGINPQPIGQEPPFLPTSD